MWKILISGEKELFSRAIFFFRNDLEDIDSTIIDGSEPVDPDTASCVLMYKPNQSFSDDSSAALIGFTLTGGKGTAWNDEHNLGSFYQRRRRNINSVLGTKNSF